MAKSAAKDPGLADRMSGDGAIVPGDYAGFQRYVRENAVPRGDAVAIARTLIDGDRMSDGTRKQLVAAGWRELAE